MKSSNNSSTTHITPNNVNSPILTQGIFPFINRKSHTNFNASATPSKTAQCFTFIVAPITRSINIRRPISAKNNQKEI